ncbi:MAG: hypothetical protein LIP09_14105 [Bacteroidales bacterium]|nr:hypothetical protein [Bacteroidales bacterium]MCC8119862.1 hypothetical protein [Bacteroidales bacterium]
MKTYKIYKTNDCGRSKSVDSEWPDFEAANWHLRIIANDVLNTKEMNPGQRAEIENMAEDKSADTFGYNEYRWWIVEEEITEEEINEDFAQDGVEMLKAMAANGCTTTFVYDSPSQRMSFAQGELTEEILGELLSQDSKPEAYALGDDEVEEVAEIIKDNAVGFESDCFLFPSRIVKFSGDVTTYVLAYEIG